MQYLICVVDKMRALLASPIPPATCLILKSTKGFLFVCRHQRRGFLVLVCVTEMYATSYITFKGSYKLFQKWPITYNNLWLLSETYFHIQGVFFLFYRQAPARRSASVASYAACRECNSRRGELEQ